MAEWRKAHRSSRAVVTSFALIVLCGCSQPDSHDPPPSPIGQGDELTTAIDAYTPFNAALDLVLSGDDPDTALKGLATQSYIDELILDASTNPRTTITEGASSFSEEKLVDPVLTTPQEDLALVVCRDVSRTRIVNVATGDDVSPSNRRIRIPLVISFYRDTSTGDLLVGEVDQWNEDLYCDQ